MDTTMHLLDKCDRRELFRTPPDLLLGRIMQLNGRPRYHNMLNAIQLISEIMEVIDMVHRRPGSR